MFYFLRLNSMKPLQNIWYFSDKIHHVYCIQVVFHEKIPLHHDPTLFQMAWFWLGNMLYILPEPITIVTVFTNVFFIFSLCQRQPQFIGVASDRLNRKIIIEYHGNDRDILSWQDSFLALSCTEISFFTISVSLDMSELVMLLKISVYLGDGLCPSYVVCYLDNLCLHLGLICLNHYSGIPLECQIS